MHINKSNTTVISRAHKSTEYIGEHEQHGILLTRHWHDRPSGVEVVLWAKVEGRPVKMRFSGGQAVCFVRRDDASQPDGLSLPSGASRRELDLRTLKGESVDALYFRHQSDLQNYRIAARARDMRFYESDLGPCERFLMERFIRCAFTVRGVPQAKRNYVEYHNPKLRASKSPAAHRQNLSVISFDIETDEHGALYSIATSSEQSERVFIINTGKECKGASPVSSAGKPFDTDDVVFVADEAALLSAFFDYLQHCDADVLIGWNVIQFDLMMLVRACARHGLTLRIGRGGERAFVLAPQSTGQRHVAQVPGRVVLDGIECLRAAFFRFESFSLEAVAQVMLGRGKAIDPGTDTGTGDAAGDVNINTAGNNKMTEIKRMYHKHQYALAHYNLEDCRLVRDIFARANLLEFAIARASLTGLALGRHGGSVAAFDNLYLPKLHRLGRVAPDVGDDQGNAQSSPGGYVFDSVPGIYRNVLLLDFKSLYPSIIRTFCIDPLGLHQPGDDAVPGFLGAHFNRHQHILPQLISHLWQQRDLAKSAGDAALSQAIKIIMNSFYGVLGTTGCRFFSAQLASSITRRGHELMRASRDFIEARELRVIYGDTDSLFVLFGDSVSASVAEARGRKLIDDVNEHWRCTLQREYQLQSYLEAEFEMLFDHFLMPTVRAMTTGSKKRYAGAFYTEDGLQLVIRGLESVRTDWTALARDFQKELLRRLFLEEPLEQYIRGVCSDLYAGKLDAQLVYSKRMRQALEMYKRNVPPHVQAARKMKRPRRLIRYVITRGGPQPLDGRALQPDYHHYREKQLKPIADGILHFLGTSFDHVAGHQPQLF